jgi:hypothetical protein
MRLSPRHRIVQLEKAKAVQKPKSDLPNPINIPEAISNLRKEGSSKSVNQNVFEVLSAIKKGNQCQNSITPMSFSVALLNSKIA